MGHIAYDEIFFGPFLKVLKGTEANEATFTMVFKVPHLKKVTKFMVYKLIYPLSPNLQPKLGKSDGWKLQN